MVAIGAEVRRHRKARRLSQERLAELTGLHRTYIGMVEHGQRTLSVTTLIALARALGTSVATLVATVPRSPAP
jgi:transcriptional regulator with XRE-family HTH domain